LEAAFSFERQSARILMPGHAIHGPQRRCPVILAVSIRLTQAIFAT